MPREPSLMGSQTKRERLHQVRSRETVGCNEGESMGRRRWRPPGVDFAGLPKDVRAAVAEIVDPLYEQLVVGVHDALEKSTGLTVVHLVWQEILDQQKLGKGYQDDPLLESLGNREETLARHLQLIDAKVKASYVLVRLRELRHLWDAPGKRPPTPVGPLLSRPLAPALGVEPIVETLPKTSGVSKTSDVRVGPSPGEHEPVIEPPPEAPPDAEKRGSC